MPNQHTTETPLQLVALRMPEDLRDALRAEAEAEGTSFSETVRRAAAAWVDRRQDARATA